MKNLILFFFILICSAPYLMAQKNIVLNNDWTLLRKRTMYTEQRYHGGQPKNRYAIFLLAHKKMKIENIYYKGNWLLGPYIDPIQTHKNDTIYINFNVWLEDYRNDEVYWDITQQINTPYTICMSYRLNGKLHYMGINKKYIRYIKSTFTGVKD